MAITIKMLSIKLQNKIINTSNVSLSALDKAMQFVLFGTRKLTPRENAYYVIVNNFNKF